MDRLAGFYTAPGFHFDKHRHGEGPEHWSSTIGETVFEIYPVASERESTVSTRLGFSVPSLEEALERLKDIHAAILTWPSDTPYGRRAVVRDFEGQ